MISLLSLKCRSSLKDHGRLKPMAVIGFEKPRHQDARSIGGKDLHTQVIFPLSCRIDRLEQYLSAIVKVFALSVDDHVFRLGVCIAVRVGFSLPVPLGA